MPKLIVILKYFTSGQTRLFYWICFQKGNWLEGITKKKNPLHFISIMTVSNLKQVLNQTITQSFIKYRPIKLNKNRNTVKWCIFSRNLAVMSWQKDTVYLKKYFKFNNCVPILLVNTIYIYLKIRQNKSPETIFP